MMIKRSVYNICPSSFFKSSDKIWLETFSLPSLLNKSRAMKLANLKHK